MRNTLIAVGSWRGTGTTTSALLLASVAATLGHNSRLVEADPSGGVLAARIPDLRATTGTTLESIAFGSSTAPLSDQIDLAGRTLGPTRIVCGPSDSFQAWSAMSSPRVDWVNELRRLDGIVVVDVGTLRGGVSPAWRVLEQADAVIMCSTSDPASLVSTVGWIDAKGQAMPGVSGLPANTARLLVVDAPTVGTERFTSDVAHELGPRFAGWWPWEPRTVDAVIRGASLDHRSVRKSALARAVTSTASTLMGGGQ